MSGRGVVGLDIGSSGVRAAELSFGRGPAELVKFGQLALPEGAVRAGEVADIETVAAGLRSLWRQVRFSTKKVALGVANQRVVVRQVDLPWMPAAEMRSSLVYQVADVVPMPVDQALLDFHPLEELADAEGSRQSRILLVAAAKEMVRNAVASVTRAGLTPVLVDLNAFALLRSVADRDPLHLATEAEAIVDVGANVTNIIVHCGGTPRFVRILIMGGADVTDAVAERMGVPMAEAETVKQGMGLPEPGQPPGHPGVRACESAAMSWVEEVRGSLDYYSAQPETVRIARIVLAGGAGRLAGLARRLSAATRLPVVPADPLSGLKIGRTGLSDDQLAYIEPLACVSVGLALGDAA